MLYSNGSALLNGNSLPESSAIFPGDTVQTAAHSLAKINASGSILIVLSDSLVQFEGSALKLERGAVAISTSRGMATRMGQVTVAPAEGQWAKFVVTNVNGEVQVAAQKGDVTVSDSTGTTTLAQGQETTREAEPSEDNKKKKKRRAGGAVPGASASALDSPLAIGIGLGAVGGLATWVLLQGGAPVSPSH